MKIVHINESKFNAILEEKKELPFQTFYEEVLKFIKGLLNDPIGTKPSEILKEYGLHNGMLRKKLLDYGIIKKEEDIREPYDETNGNQESRYYVSYKVPRDNFNAIKTDIDGVATIETIIKDKLRKFHNSLLNVNENITRDEINMMLNSPLTMGVVCNGNAPEYVKQATDIYNNKIKKNKKYETKN